MTLAEHYKGRDIAIINSNVIIFILLEKVMNLGKLPQLFDHCTLRVIPKQESELTVLYISCSLNKPLLSLSHNSVGK